MLTIAPDLVPVNYKGKPNDLEFFITLPSWAEAHELFNQAMKRLLKPDIWHNLAGWASAHFTLIGADGNPIRRSPETGDYLRIDIPGPGPMQGHGYDWVTIQNIDDYFDVSGEQEWVAMKVHPSPAPGKTGVAAHFFESEASSTFIIQRSGNKVTSRYHGRNEVPNTSTGQPVDNIRNAMVAAGAMLSFSEVQWSALCKAFIAWEDTGEKSAEGQDQPDK